MKSRRVGYWLVGALGGAALLGGFWTWGVPAITTQPPDGRVVLTVRPQLAVPPPPLTVAPTPLTLQAAVPTTGDPVSRMRLIGVVITQAGSPAGPGPTAALGYALISVDGRPPVAYAVGAQVEPGLTLAEIAPAMASLVKSGTPGSIVLTTATPRPPPPVATPTMPSGVPVPQTRVAPA